LERLVSLVAAVYCPEGPHLNGIAETGARAVRFDVGDITRM
jgi:hypothetical protein